MEALGIDIGGSGVKGAPVDIETGTLLAPRLRIATPKPVKPKAMGEIIATIVEHFKWDGAIGCGFPAAIPSGVALNVANLHKKWEGIDVSRFLSDIVGKEISVINDADAAGIAEMSFGAGRGEKGVVLMVTLGTGLGTALFTQGKILPNVELGHIEIKGRVAEQWASVAARKRYKLSWQRWGKRLNTYLNYLESLFYPDLIILGGGISKRHEKFFPYLKLRARVVPAQLYNNAGIVGAAAIYKGDLTVGIDV